MSKKEASSFLMNQSNFHVLYLNFNRFNVFMCLRMFLFTIRPAEVAPVEETRVVRKAPTETAIPYIVQPGFNVPDGVPSGRFLLAFGTTTTTVTSTTTYVSSLTAICQSTTAYQLCGSTGK
jgi:hypothetical protein